MYKKIAELNFRDTNHVLPKFLRRMKLTFAFMVITLIQVQASTYAQRVSLSVKNASLTEVITKIRKQADVDFLYNSDMLSALKPITLRAKNEDLQQVLEKCFEGQPYSFRLQNKSVLIFLKSPNTIEFNDKKVADVEVTGTVTDENKEPLAGVIVNLKGSTTSATTDVNGKYKIRVPDNGVLVFRFLGSETQEIPVTGKVVIDVVLKTTTSTLNDVVVVGYGTQKQKDLTGSVGFVTAENMNKGPQLTPQQLLQGKVAGANISLNSGKPGTSNTIRIRGGQSLTQSNEPLYVIDGVPIAVTNLGQSNIAGGTTNVFDQEPINPLQTLNPNDIESISVLKDASATAIYGSRAANGVIVITTKSGKTGKAQVAYNGNLSVANVAKKLDVLSADEYRNMVRTVGKTLDDKGANTNWQDQIFRTAVSNDHNVALSGGSDKTSYRTSMGYGNQQGIVLNSNLRQANILANINHKALNDRLKFDLRLSYGQNKSNVAPLSSTVGGEAGTSMNFESYVFNPTYPVYDPTGAYYNVQPYRVNPVSFSTELIDQKFNERLLGNLTTSYKIIEPLSINVTLGYTRNNTERNSYIYRSKGTSPLGNGLNGYASVQKFADYTRLMETILRFNKSYGKHSIEALAGYSYQYFYGESTRIQANNFLSDNFKWNALQSAGTVIAPTSGAGSNTLLSMYARANYNFDDRYLVTATVRRDGSSRFGSDNKWGYFPSGSVAWRISKEKFFNVKAISDLKLRASYGLTGNQDIANLLSLTILSPSTAGYIIGGQRVSVVGLNQFTNPGIKWEQTSQLDIGLNFGLFNNRLHGAIDYYRKKTNDLLLQINLPQPSAVQTGFVNAGSVENKGIEVELGGAIIDKKDFGWDANLVFSRNINKVLSLSNDLYSASNIPSAPVQGTASGGNTQLILPGQPIGTFYGRVFNGLDAQGMETYAAGGSQILGNAQPKFTYGFSNTFTYKQWSLVANLRGSNGNKVYNLTANNLGYKITLPGRNTLRSVINDGVAYNQAQNYSSRWIEDGSFLRLDNATISYNVKLKSQTISNLRLFVNGQNLFIITKYTGLDPEVNAEISRTGTAPLGIDYLGYPRARTYSLGANVTF